MFGWVENVRGKKMGTQRNGEEKLYSYDKTRWGERIETRGAVLRGRGREEFYAIYSVISR